MVVALETRLVRLARGKYSSLFCLFFSDEAKQAELFVHEKPFEQSNCYSYMEKTGKACQGENTLAYFASLSLTKRQSKRRCVSLTYKRLVRLARGQTL